MSFTYDKRLLYFNLMICYTARVIMNHRGGMCSEHRAVYNTKTNYYMYNKYRIIIIQASTSYTWVYNICWKIEGTVIEMFFAVGQLFTSVRYYNNIICARLSWDIDTYTYLGADWLLYRVTDRFYTLSFRMREAQRPHNFNSEDGSVGSCSKCIRVSCLGI